MMICIHRNIFPNKLYTFSINSIAKEYPFHLTSINKKEKIEKVKRLLK